ncbi:hypothetical protein NSK_001013 [Nannochloropsis salina CCMP1776]|uniref:DUF1445 domain-containing protein n=1 Tax=Nannochloropsis salina CCMP1776 TaxID=1027361 RepID=A0A4D9DC53_9STRA|nr:hypothetical protein NSK_001013 [Nannochloropsis salina CCMP1776]|eukprot:TFJ87663.1 hypothetical protein NSK_001013 [Nannochloropsis salina CCMP1776]
MTFCIRNPKPCPLLDVTDPGCPNPPTWLANDGADVRTDLPMYRVWQNGKLLKEADDVTDYWRDDFVAFFLGCSFSFEEALVKANLSNVILDCRLPGIAITHAPGAMFVTDVLNDFLTQK